MPYIALRLWNNVKDLIAPIYCLKADTKVIQINNSRKLFYNYFTKMISKRAYLFENKNQLHENKQDKK